jgi:glyoxylase-like metal-dependent hydrolase (beta-lactamase superfamily II)
LAKIDIHWESPMPRFRTIFAFAAFALAAATYPAAGPAEAQGQAPQISQVTGGIHVIRGRGGNIGVSVGEDGVFMIDDQFAPVTEQLRKLIAGVSDKPIRFLLNTHFHGDHTGGNENLGSSGVTIFAHDNVRARLLGQGAPKAALPVVTFNDTTTFHMNGQTIHVFHAADAHTDGDTMIHFREADVIHMGDTYFNGFYPFIDVASGGSLEGTLAAVDQALALAGDNTRIIPGHGPMSNKAELMAYRNMLIAARDGIQPMVADGKTVEQVVAAKPTAALDGEWGDGFLNPERFVRIVYSSLNK